MTIVIAIAAPRKNRSFPTRAETGLSITLAIDNPPVPRRQFSGFAGE
jgi:hypothetical protein